MGIGAHMGRLNMLRALLVSGLIVVALLLAMLGCTRVDEVTPTATPIVTVTPQIAELAEHPGPTPVPVIGTATPTPGPTRTPRPPTPTSVPVNVQYECEVGLRLEPGEACTYRDDEQSDFVLAVLDDGSTLLNGRAGPLTVRDRITEPASKVCVCGLETEPDGMARTITALPKPIRTSRVERFELPPSPFLGECVAGLKVGAGELCRYPGTICIFDVTVDGKGHFLGVSNSNEVVFDELTRGDITLDFRAVDSGGDWTIQSVPGPMGDSFRAHCPVDERVDEIVSAIRQKEVDQVQRYIDADLDLNARDGIYGFPLVLVAAIAAESSNNTQIVRMLIDAGADVNRYTANGAPLLNGAAIRGSARALRMLVDSGSDTNARDYYGYTALRRALQGNTMERAQALIEGGADVNALDYSGSPLLHHQLLSGRTDAVSVLLDAGADLNALGRSGEAMLSAALGGRGRHGASDAGSGSGRECPLLGWHVGLGGGRQVGRHDR